MKPLIVINRLMIRPGKIEELVARQQAFAASLPPCGLLGGRMYKSLDGRSATLVSIFESQSALDAVRERADFKAHVASLAELVESSSPATYEEAYTTGDFR